MITGPFARLFAFLDRHPRLNVLCAVAAGALVLIIDANTRIGL